MEYLASACSLAMDNGRSRRRHGLSSIVSQHSGDLRRRVRAILPLHPELAQDVRGQLGLARAGEDTFQVQPTHTVDALHRGEVGKVPDLHTDHKIALGCQFEIATDV